MQNYRMDAVVTMSKRGTITLPPAIRKKLGLGKVSNPMMLIREQDGRIIMEPAAAIPLRNIPRETVDGWIAEDEAAMEAFKKSEK